MIARVWRRSVRFLGSAGFATVLLAFVGLWSFAATFIPQGEPSNPAVAVWASAHPFIEPVVRAIGLHQAFTSVVFAVSVLLLSVSTALCAWRRTRVAAHRGRALAEAARADERSVSGSHDFEIFCDPVLSESEVLPLASETLKDLGIKTRRRGDVLSAVSPAWSVWGSPIFHWALLALIVVVLASNLQRSEGKIGVAVGQTKPDAPESYGSLHTGPLHSWRNVHRSIRVDAFDLQFRTGGIDRGPTPTVSVLDEAGRVIKTQRVYPNHQLKTGSLAIYPSTYGLSAAVSFVNTSGVETGRFVELMDFSETAGEGTVPAQSIGISNSAGNVELVASVAVPLERTDGQLDKWLPEDSKARVVVTSLDGQPLVDRVVSPGEDVALPIGGSLRVDNLGYYARLQVVDDWSTIPLYVCLVAATIGLTIAFVVSQQIVLATVIEGPDGMKLAATARLWRNTLSTRSTIESKLTQALCDVTEERTS